MKKRHDDDNDDNHDEDDNDDDDDDDDDDVRHDNTVVASANISTPIWKKNFRRKIRTLYDHLVASTFSCSAIFGRCRQWET